MQPRGIEVDDLHGVVMSYGKEKLITPDGTHMSDEASRLLAEAVVESVLRTSGGSPA